MNQFQRKTAGVQGLTLVSELVRRWGLGVLGVLLLLPLRRQDILTMIAPSNNSGTLPTPFTSAGFRAVHKFRNLSRGIYPSPLFSTLQERFGQNVSPRALVPKREYSWSRTLQHVFYGDVEKLNQFLKCAIGNLIFTVACDTSTTEQPLLMYCFTMLLLHFHVISRKMLKWRAI